MSKKPTQRAATEYHTPYWPSMQDTARMPPERVLAGMARDGSLFAEDGRTWPKPATWDALSALLQAEYLQLYVGSPLDTWLREWWQDICAELEPETAIGERLRWIKQQGRTRYVVLHWSPTAGAVVSLSVHLLAPGRTGKRCWQERSIVQSSTWGEKEPSFSFLQSLRGCFRLILGPGTATTPGSAGSQTMFALWREHADGTMPRHHRPTSACLADLTEHAVGSYKDAWRPNEVFQTVWELDRTNGFASECRILPAGTVRGPLKGAHARLLSPALSGGATLPCFTWFGHCAVRIAAPGLPAGDVAPFLVRSLAPGEGRHALLANEQSGRNKPLGELYAPTQPGIYDVWLWKEEADEIIAREAEGFPIRLESIDYAWYWERSTEQLAEWAERLDATRRRAMAACDQVARMVKACIVAAIGRLGMAGTRYGISTEGGDDESARLLDAAGPDAPPLYLRECPGDSGAPKHWHAYILMKQNLSILQLLHELWKEGIRVVGPNVDAVVCLDKPGSLGVDPAAARLGEYKLRAVGGGIFFAMPGPGIQISPEKLRTPGIPADIRAVIMEHGTPLHGLPASPKREEAKQAQRAMKAARLAVQAEPSWEESFRRCMRLRNWYVKQRGAYTAGELAEQWAPLRRREQILRGAQRE